MDVLLYLTYFAVILVIGLMSVKVANKINIPSILVLLLIGFGLSRLLDFTGYDVYIPQLTVFIMSLIAVIVVLFYFGSKVDLKEVRWSSVKYILVDLSASLVLITAAIMFLFDMDIYLSVVLAAIISMVWVDDNKFLAIESGLNHAILFLVGFVALDLALADPAGVALFSLDRIVTGLGAGFIIGVLMFSIMRKKFNKVLSPLYMVSGALLSYVFAENLNGSGAVAVLMAGLFFGNIYVKHKLRLIDFSHAFAKLLGIYVFLLIGLLAPLFVTVEFLLKAALLYVLFLVVRYLVLSFFTKPRLSLVIVPKGIGPGVLLLALLPFADYSFEFDIVIGVGFLIMLYSLVVSLFIRKRKLNSF